MGKTVTTVLALLVAAGVVVAGGVGGGQGGGAQPADAGDAAAASEASAAAGSNAGGDASASAAGSDDVTVAAEDSGVDVSVAMDWGGVALENVGGDDGAGEGRVTHDAIDEGMADTGRAGACAVGLDGDGSPLDLAFDGGNSTFLVDFSANGSASGSDGGVEGDASEIVAECSGSSDAG